MSGAARGEIAGDETAEREQESYGERDKQVVAAEFDGQESGEQFA